jgi:phenol hydroxylase P1 protein
MPDAWKELIGSVVVPLRHYEAGGQLVTINGARFSYGTTIEQCLTYAAFDRIGNAQMISRVGITLGGGTTERLTDAKEAWMCAPHHQGLRRLAEELLVERDWAIAAVALDLVDQLLYPLLYEHLDEAAVTVGAGAYSLIAQHMRTWFAEHRRWLEALYDSWLKDPEHGEANRAALGGVVRSRLQQAVEAVTDVAKAMDAIADTGAVTAAAVLTTSLADRGLSEVAERA